MKLGYFVANQYPAGESAADRIKENLEQVRVAKDAGFDLICAGQHYLSDPYQMPATFPFLARLAAESGDMQLAATVILAPPPQSRGLGRIHCHLGCNHRWSFHLRSGSGLP